MKKLLFISLLFLGLLTACSGGGSSSIVTDDVITAFQDAGLKADAAREMTKDDYGVGPMKADEGQIVKIGDDMNARILSYENEDDLDEMKAYYDEMGKESAMLFSWTMNHENILVQMNGDLPEEEYNKYKEALESL